MTTQRMARAACHALIALLTVCALSTWAQGANEAITPAEPPGLWTGPMVSATPATLQGASVIDAPALARLMSHPPVLLIDVGPADHKPDPLPPGTVWRPNHRSIPGAHWFPGAGRGDLTEAQAQAWLQRIDQLAGGNRALPIVTFCKPSCWGSWNAGKRLVAAGYTAVHWFPAGVHGWQEHHDTTALEPDATWAALPK